MAEKSAIQARVHGLVQGVGFRYHTRSAAVRIGVCGWVRNNGDGTVEVYAEGSPNQIRKMEDYLHTGPPHAQVTHVEIRRPHPSETYRTFSITY